MELTPNMKNMGFRLVDTTEADVDDYIRVKRITYKKYIDEHREFFGEWSDEMEFHAFFIRRKQTFFKKLLLHNEIVGFMGYDLKEGKIADVSIHIVEKAQNKGIGTCFILNLIELSKGFRKPILIEVAKSNPAQNLYRRLGFEVYKEKDAFYFLKYNP